MSLFGAMNTAISGLTAQSAAFGNISDNVANSQTVGFKRVDTSFIDYLTVSNAANNIPGAVVARPDYVNTVQGTISQSDNPLALAISGQGFFAVSHQSGSTTTGSPEFDQQQYYSRAGDFTMDKNGYLMNSAGEYLNGWPVNATTGAVDRNTLAPIQISQTEYNPVATSQVTLSANLPATPSSTATTSSQVNIYDALGTMHTVTLDWTQNASGDWTVAINSPDDISAASRGTADVQFGAASGNSVPAGTIGNIGSATGSVSTSSYAANGDATLSFTTDFGSGPQAVTLNLGSYGGATGLTQFAGTDYSLRGISQNGVPPGAFSSVTTTSAGDIVVNYDNGQSRTIARVPVITFNAPDALQRQDGQSFTATIGSGNPTADDAGSNGAGNLVTSSTESSNVDIATEFSKLIVAQQAYSANTKVVTTASDLMQQTIDMKR
jgi:flagellar hook protein FlgE